jgi:hypothetical protein
MQILLVAVEEQQYQSGKHQQPRCPCGAKDSIISVYKTSDHTQILEIIEIKNEGEK